MKHGYLLNVAKYVPDSYLSFERKKKGPNIIYFPTLLCLCFSLFLLFYIVYNLIILVNFKYIYYIFSLMLKILDMIYIKNIRHCFYLKVPVSILVFWTCISTNATKDNKLLQLHTVFFWHILVKLLRYCLDYDKNIIC